MNIIAKKTMIKIKNPFISKEDFNCIGCSPRNPIGIKLDFFLDQKKSTVLSEWEPNPNFQGYQNVLHGGIQAMLLDEIASWVVYTVIGTGGVTSQLQIRYRKPVYISEGPIRLKAWVDKKEKRLADIKTELYNGKDILCAEALVQYWIYPENIAKEKFGYPGIEGFI
jgi:acyl-coenzyme A thioesterase PaaI-like protein